MPLDGEVIEVNPALDSSPELVNEDPLARLERQGRAHHVRADRQLGCRVLQAAFKELMRVTGQQQRIAVF